MPTARELAYDRLSVGQRVRIYIQQGAPAEGRITAKLPKKRMVVVVVVRDDETESEFTRGALLVEPLEEA